MNKKFLENKIRTFSFFLVSAFLIFITTSAMGGDNIDTTKKDGAALPNVFNENHGDLIESTLRHEAVINFPLHQLPRTKN